MTTTTPSVLIHTTSLEGHRSSYLSLLSQLLNGARTQRLREMFFTAKPLFLLSIEASAFPLYCLVAPLRALIGRRTVGLLMRPYPVLTGTSSRLRLKRILLKLLHRLPYIQTLTILPFSVEPRFADIADGWIYDPQLWDLTPEERTQAEGRLFSDIRAAAQGRPVCCAIGRQDHAKGFDWFAKLYAEHAAMRDEMLFAFAGKVATDSESWLPIFERAGGYACNRFISNTELLDIYASADLIWCAYTPDYDQASGILGRAAQLGIPAVVRRDSLAHRLCRSEALAHIAFDPATDWRQLIGRLQREAPQQTLARQQRMRDQSLKRLHHALGLLP